MKLYEVYINNGMYYEDESHVTILMVGISEEEIENNITTEEFLYNYMIENNEDAYYEIKEIKEIDGYEIKLIKK